MKEKFYTIQEVASMLKVTETAVRNWIYERQTLGAYRVGGAVRISEKELRSFVKKVPQDRRGGSNYIRFCHIAPTAYLDLVKNQEVHLVLAHLVDSDRNYEEFYRGVRGVKIMDNSAFEMFKQNKPMMSSAKLIDLAERVKADYIVLSDYPNESWEKTKKVAEQMIPIVRSAGFKTFYVPQSVAGDLEGYLSSVMWGLNNSDIDLVGISILGAPIAFDVESSNNLQRYLSRYRVFTLLNSRLSDEHFDKIHCLGMVDGPNEIELLKDFAPYIYSWDSSSAVWAGLNGITYDGSPTGLIDGKFEKEVDFAFEFDDTHLDKVTFNMSFIDELCGEKP